MPIIDILTAIEAPPERCFKLALSVDLHTISTSHTQETIVAGVQQGILGLGDSVTFRARHFGIWQRLTSQVMELEKPVYFCDEMQRGAFKRMRHEHYFQAQDDGSTSMRDTFIFESPLGWLGQLVDALVLKRYLRRFLRERCLVIKRYAETDAWQEVIEGQESNQK